MRQLGIQHGGQQRGRKALVVSCKNNVPCSVKHGNPSLSQSVSLTSPDCVVEKFATPGSMRCPPPNCGLACFVDTGAQRKAQNQKRSRRTPTPRRPGLMSSSSSALAKHVQTFADPNGDLTSSSMRCPHYRLQLYSKFSPTLALKVKAISKLGKTTRQLVKVHNPAASQIWDAQGKFDEQAFADLFDRHGSLVDSGGGQIQAITRQGFDAFCKSKATPESSAAACTLLGLVLSWQRITAGSLDELFSLFANCTTNDNRPAITRDALYEFYTEPDKALRSKFKK